MDGGGWRRAVTRRAHLAWLVVAIALTMAAIAWSGRGVDTVVSLVAAMGGAFVAYGALVIGAGIAWNRDEREEGADPICRCGNFSSPRVAFPLAGVARRIALLARVRRADGRRGRRDDDG